MGGVKQKIIFSEQFYVTADPHEEIVTVLGSCVAVCLWDTKHKICAMNHYLLPLWNGDGLQSLKFGNISTQKMIEAMFRAGSTKRNMVAKIFGGALININEALSVGPRNIQIARAVLQEDKIPIVSEDIGGPSGRKIYFSNEDGSVHVKYSKNS
jgi:chemotaxis protein CheD